MQMQNLPETRSEEVVYNASSIAGEYIVEYGVVTCCSALDWMLREIYPNLEYKKIGKELRKSKPGASGCVSLPYFQGRVTPDHNSEAKAVFAGISLSTKKADILRAFIESIGYETFYGINAMPERPKEIRINGGLTGTPEICQILSDILGRTISINRENDPTAFGAFLAAKVADGTYESVKTAYESLRKAPVMEKYEPDVKQAKWYENHREDNFNLYQRVYGHETSRSGGEK
jgi:sugar (pentulose or hexulose) kinase